MEEDCVIMRVLISADGRMPVDLSEDTNLIASYDDVPAFVTEYDRQFHELEGKPEQRTPLNCRIKSGAPLQGVDITGVPHAMASKGVCANASS